MILAILVILVWVLAVNDSSVFLALKASGVI